MGLKLPQKYYREGLGPAEVTYFSAKNSVSHDRNMQEGRGYLALLALFTWYVLHPKSLGRTLEIAAYGSIIALSEEA